ncbi:MAG TPA: serine/threonine-protein kinase [Gemmatimonadales bacterium]|nr:serine/threonine-protein kinase [Gemmatimonadales bacterium]
MQRLFEKASRADPGRREAMLREVGMRDSAMEQRLRRMLELDATPHALLDRGLASLAERSMPAGALPAAVGPYRIIRLLGEGGMGVVYLVERTDVGGMAALKLLRDAWLSPSRRLRFASEQRLLAQLNHPSIAQLHDAGALDDGTPWFAMEYVEGRNLVDYCRDNRLSVNDRVRLIRAVAEAVQHAHGRTVIHRDLKPSNVLVTEAGLVKLLDFGIAKQIDDTGETGERTVTGLRMLTPAYAAPEQFTGGPIGVHTDVYAMGAMLFELVTGSRPFPEASTSDPAVIEARLAEPVRPSAAPGRDTAIPGRPNWDELDVIVRTAMHPDPDRRYRTAYSLIRDIDRYLRGEPLEARPDSLGYRMSRFVRRNARAVAITGVLAALLIGMSAYYAVGLRDARDAAVAEAARTARIQGFMTSLFQGGDDAVGAPDTLRVRTLIDRGIREAVALDAEPAVQAEMFLTLGGLLRQQGRTEESDSLLGRALAIRRELVPADHPDIAVALTALATLRIDQARYDDADSLLRQAALIVDRRLNETDDRAIETHATLGLLRQEQARWPEAISEQEGVLRRLAARSGSPLETADATVQLANSHFYAGELDASDSLNRLALAAFRRLRGDQHPSVADALINLGAAEFERGRYAAAEGYFREALSRIEGWHGPEHPATASALTMLGRALTYQSRHADAGIVLARAVAIQEAAFGPEHPRVSSALNEMASIALQRGDYAEAERLWRRTEAIQLKVHGERHWLLGIARSNLGTVRTRIGDFIGAERYFRSAIALFTESQGAGHLNTGIARIKLGRALLGQRRWRDAMAESQAGLDVLLALPEAPQGFIDAARENIADGRKHLGDLGRSTRLPQ